MPWRRDKYAPTRWAATAWGPAWPGRCQCCCWRAGSAGCSCWADRRTAAWRPGCTDTRPRTTAATATTTSPADDNGGRVCNGWCSYCCRCSYCRWPTTYRRARERQIDIGPRRCRTAASRSPGRGCCACTDRSEWRRRRVRHRAHRREARHPVAAAAPIYTQSRARPFELSLYDGGGGGEEITTGQSCLYTFRKRFDFG